MDKITIWHNPRCSKSREAMSILEENGCEIEVIKYLEVEPTKEQITTVLSMLGCSVREWMRTKEDIYKELNLKNQEDEQKLIEAMVMHPKLIERPVLIKNNKAIIGRPTSIIAEFINS